MHIIKYGGTISISISYDFAAGIYAQKQNTHIQNYKGSYKGSRFTDT